MVRIILFPLLVLAYILPNPGLASPGLSPEQAADLVRQTMAKAGVAGADPVAPSRALPDCSGTVTAAPRAGDWSTVALSCDNPLWTRALRTRAAPTIAAPRDGSLQSPVIGTALGLTRSLAKGAVIGAADIGPVPLVNATPAEIFTNPVHLEGRRLRQTLAPGKPVLARHLEPDYLVVQSGQVVIITQSGGFTVSSMGRAEASAALGDVVIVTNLSSGRNVQARVSGKDIVTVTLKPASPVP